MRKAAFVCTAVSSLFLASASNAAVVWNGPTTVFAKADFADWTLAHNQDRITDDVWITRASSQGLFNINQEAFFTHNSSPAGTRWAYGSAANWQSLTFNNWEDWAGGSGNIPSIIGQDAVLHLVDEDIYLDIKFLSWTSGGAGGGFSYERSTVPEPASLLLLGFAACSIRRRVR